MSSARAQANQSLYLAKILLGSWQVALAAEELPARTLNQAFVPAVREHLLDAYGWFLLELSGADSAAGKPPHSCNELADVAAGKAIPGEIREFQQLETDGWLAQLLAAQQGPGASPGASRTPGNLSVTATAGLPDCDQMGEWLARLERVFERMSDSLDEC
jgi:hypothetical protein